MTERLERTLAAEFPFMRDVEYGGIDCGDGWYPLIRELCRDITEVYATAGQPVDVVVQQVKEKYGQLRFYCRASLWIEELIETYEERSAQVCEVCGMAGCLRAELPWIQTLCDEHYEQAKAR